MLSEQDRERVARRVKNITDKYRAAKAEGYGRQTLLALPTFDCQDDFERYLPEDKNMDFRKHNELTTETLKGLVKNGISAEPVLIRYPDFAEWLEGRPISPDARADYAAYALELERGKKKGGVS